MRPAGLYERCKLALELKSLKTPALRQNHKNQRVAICASLLARHRLAREQHRPFLSCIVTGDEKWCLYVNIRKRKEWFSPNKRDTPRTKKDLLASTKDNVMHLVEQRGYAVLRIASPRCNQHS